MGLRRVIMRIRFRASDFGLVAKISTSFVQNRNRLLVRRRCSGHSFFYSCDSALRFLDSENSSPRRLLLRPRRECTSLGPGLKHPSLCSDFSLRRDVPRRFTWYFLKTKHPSPARELLLCAFSRMIRSHERRALGALLCLFSRSESASTDS